MDEENFWLSLNADQQNRLMSIVAAAAPPEDRRTQQYFKPTLEQDSQRIDARTQQWLDAAAAGNSADLDQLLRWLDLDASDFKAGLVDVEVRDPAQLPPWARAFVKFIQALNTHQPIQAQERNRASQNPSSPDPELRPEINHQEIYQSLQGAARLWLDCILASTTRPISASAANQIAQHIANRLLIVVTPTLEFEQQIATVLHCLPKAAIGSQPLPGTDLTVDAWLERLGLLPGVAYLLGVLCLNWETATIEMLERLEQDWPLLVSQLWGGADPGELTDFRGDAGDPHDGGRSVAILTFAQGQKVVYKTKDLRGAKAFLDLTAWLNQHGLQPQLPERMILPCDGYGWEQFVVARTCQNREQVARFYYRMGMTLRLLQLLDARDFWLDNLLADGEFPVFIDLETLLQGQTFPATPLSPASSAINTLLQASVVPTAAVTCSVTIAPGVPAEDIGALTPKRRLKTPFRSRRPANRIDSDAHTAGESSYIHWSPPSYAPMLAGNPVPVTEHLEDLVNGYRNLQVYLVQHQQALLADDGPLSVFANLPMRYIVRDTWSCYKIMQTAGEPAALFDGVAREIILSRLYRSVFQVSDPEGYANVIQSEVAALRNCDVPLFIIEPSSRSLFTPRGEELCHLFSETAYGEMRSRLLSINAFDVDQHVDILCSCIDSGEAGRLPFSQHSKRVVPAVDNVKWLDSATLIGDEILRLRTIGVEGESAWLGLRYDPVHDLQGLGELNPDLLTGTCGLAVLFSDLAKLTGRDRYRSVALDILTGIRRSIEATLEQIKASQTTPQSAARIQWGGFLGMGSQLYTLRRCAAALGDTELRQLAITLARSIPLDSLAKTMPSDVVSGLAGLLLTLLGSKEGEPLGSLAQIQLLTERLIETTQSKDSVLQPLYPPGVTRLDGLPGAEVGIELAVARAASVLSDLDSNGSDWLDRSTAGQSVDLKTDLKASQVTAGTLLAKLGCSQNKCSGTLLDAVRQFVSSNPRDSSSTRLLDVIEVAVLAHQVSGDAELLKQGCAVGQHLVARFDATETWFPNRIAADRHNLSIIWGTAAIAHAFIKLAEPTQFLSIRLLG